jgi:hypothetical protein
MGNSFTPFFFFSHLSHTNLATHPKHIAGFIDLVDILAYLVTLTSNGVTDDNAANLASAFLNKRVGELMGMYSIL